MFWGWDLKKDLSALDKKLIRCLIENGRAPVAEISKDLNITNPTVRSRIQRLIESGVSKVVGLVDCSKIKGITMALVGITLERHQELEKKTEQISNLDRVHWVAVVSGRYDIIVEVVLEDAMDDLYRFLTMDLPQLGGIRSSESFLVMKAKRKWVLLPSGMKNWDT